MRGRASATCTSSMPSDGRVAERAVICGGVEPLAAALARRRAARPEPRHLARAAFVSGTRTAATRRRRSTRSLATLARARRSRRSRVPYDAFASQARSRDPARQRARSLHRSARAPRRLSRARHRRAWSATRSRRDGGLPVLGARRASEARAAHVGRAARAEVRRALRQHRSRLAKSPRRSRGHRGARAASCRGRLPARLRGSKRLRAAPRSSPRSAASSSRANDRWGFVGPRAERARRSSRASSSSGDGRPRGRRRRARTTLFRVRARGVRDQRPLARGRSRRRGAVPLPRGAAADRARRPGARCARSLGVEAVMLSPQGAQRADARALAQLLGERRGGADSRRAGGSPPARADVAVPAERRLPRARSPRRRRRGPDAVVAGDARDVGAGADARSARCSAATPRPRRARRRPSSASTTCAARRLRPPRLRRSRSSSARSGSRRAFGWFALAQRRRLGAAAPALAPGVPVRRARGARDRRARRRAARGRRGARRSSPADSGACATSASPTSSTSSTARGGPLLASGSFYFVLLVTVLWTVVNVALHVAHRRRARAPARAPDAPPAGGLPRAADRAVGGAELRHRARVEGHVPPAVRRHQRAHPRAERVFGAHVEPIAWFSRFSTAFAANVATNVWLGFPFMMVVTLGALTSVPDDVLEAARGRRRDALAARSAWSRCR